MRPLTVLCDGRRLEPHTATFSNVDPGGFQALMLKADGADLVAVDTPVHVLLGADTAWYGLVNEPGAATRDTRADDQLGAVGYGAALRDNPFSVVYVDSRLSEWKGPGTQRRINLITAGYAPGDASVRSDSGSPALATEATGSWSAGAKSLPEGWYDAGQGNNLAALYYSWKKGSTINAADTLWAWRAHLLTDDVASSYDDSGNLRAAGPSGGTLTATAARRFAMVNLFYGDAGGEAGKPYGIDWTCLQAIGDHRIPLRGTPSSSQGYGLYPHDVWVHALRRSGAGIVAGRVDDASSYLIRQLVYKDAPANGAEQIQMDLAKIMGWHTGVWGPRSLFDTAPVGEFCAPPESPTCIVRRKDCQDFDSPKIRRDSLYTRAEVKYTDAAGTVGVATVELPSTLIEGERTLQLDMGSGRAAEAMAYGRFALLLARDSARGSGSCTVGDTVMLPGGARKPAMLLRAGRDRIQIPDLPDSGSFSGERRDTFLVRRVETTIQDGRASTRIEFDGGADLMEVLNARTAMALSAANLT